MGRYYLLFRKRTDERRFLQQADGWRRPWVPVCKQVNRGPQATIQEAVRIAMQIKEGSGQHGV